MTQDQSNTPDTDTLGPGSVTPDDARWEHYDPKQPGLTHDDRAYRILDWLGIEYSTGAVDYIRQHLDAAAAENEEEPAP